MRLGHTAHGCTAAAPPAPGSPGAGPRERGAALIELSLAIGLLAVLLFGIITFGITLSYKQTMDQATNEAARAAAVAPSGMAIGLAQEAADRALSGYGTPCGSPELSCSFPITACNPTSTDGRMCMTVELRYHLRDHPRVPAGPLGTALPDELISTATVEVNP